MKKEKRKKKNVPNSWSLISVQSSKNFCEAAPLFQSCRVVKYTSSVSFFSLYQPPGGFGAIITSCFVK